MDIIIRQMQESEAKEAVKVARKSFGIVGYILIRKPKHGIVAVVDDKIVGGVFYYTKNSGAKKIGVVSFLFSDPNFQGHGIAGNLLDECIATLWEDGCDGLVTYVQDDNVASWAAFEKRGFVKTTILKSAKALGSSTALKSQLFFTQSFAFCVGADFYMALPNMETTKTYERKDISIVQIGLFILMNLILLSFIIVRSIDPLRAIAAITLLLGSTALVGWIGTWFTRRKWRFRLAQGGFISTVLASAFTIFIMIGNWYPVKYENTPKFRRDMALNSILIWLFLFVIMICNMFIDNLILEGMQNLSAALLIYRCVPILPFSSYGSGRVWNWNKPVFAVFAVVSILLVFVI